MATVSHWRQIHFLRAVDDTRLAGSTSAGLGGAGSRRFVAHRRLRPMRAAARGVPAAAFFLVGPLLGLSSACDRYQTTVQSRCVLMGRFFALRGLYAPGHRNAAWLNALLARST